MRESRSAHAAEVPEHILDELAQALAEKVDVLLDRLTDRALAAPAAGSTTWHHQWRERESSAGRAQHDLRLYIRRALAARTGIDLDTLGSPTTSGSHRAPKATRARRVKPRVDSEQLCIF